MLKSPLIEKYSKKLEYAIERWDMDNIDPLSEKIKPNAFISPIHYDLAYIKHFSTKTIEEWVKYKCRRGVIDRNLDKFFEDYKEYFFNINKVTPEKLNYLKEHNINIDNLNL